jgi:hypothetical protein
MLFDMQDDIQISGRTAEGADFAAAGETNARAIFYSCGNFGVDRALAHHTAFPLALGTRIRDDTARSLARGAGAGDAKKSLLIADLASTAAGPARGWSFPRCCAGALAGFTSFVATNRHLSLSTEECLFELDRQVFAQIGAALHTAATPSSGPAEQIAEAKQIPKNIAEILEYGRVDSHTRTSSSAESRVAVAIVNGALFRVGQHRIGLADFLELFFRVGIVGVAVGVILQSQFAVSALQLNFCAGAGYAQHFVIITFCVCCQNDTFPSGG